MAKTGIVIPYGGNVTKDEIIEVAKLAEGCGYDSVWVPEMWGRDAFSILGLIASHTKTIKLATGIVPVFSRSPAIIAQTVATLDEFSEGRIILGLGISGPIVIENWHGIKFEKPLQRTREYVEIIRLILSGERVNYEGEIFQLSNFRLQFKPPREDIPILIAALGPKNLKLAGEIADGWIPYLVPREFLQEAREVISEGAEIGERDVDEIPVCPYVPASISEDNKEEIKLLKEHIAYYIGGMGDFYYGALNRYGFEIEANSIRDAWKSKDKSQAVENVSKRLLDSVALFGSPFESKNRLEKLRNAGADLPILIFPPKAPLELVKKTIEELGPEA